jgi:hypothetical protein
VDSPGPVVHVVSPVAVVHVHVDSPGPVVHVDSPGAPQPVAGGVTQGNVPTVTQGNVPTVVQGNAPSVIQGNVPVVITVTQQNVDNAPPAAPHPAGSWSPPEPPPPTARPSVPPRVN